MTLFGGLVFTCYLGSLSFKEKLRLTDAVLGNGGKVQSLLSTSTSCIICSEEEYKKEGRKIREAKEKNVPFVFPEYIYTAIDQNRQVDRFTLILDGKMPQVPQFMENHINNMKSSVISTIRKTVNNMAYLALSKHSDIQVQNVVERKTSYMPILIQRFYNAIPVVRDERRYDSKYTGEALSLDVLREKKRHMKKKDREKEMVKFKKIEVQMLEAQNAKLERMKERQRQHEKERKIEEELKTERLQQYNQRKKSVANNIKMKEIIEANKILLNFQWKKEEGERSEFPYLISQKWLILTKNPSVQDKIQVAKTARSVFGTALLRDISEENKNKEEEEDHSKMLYADVIRVSLGLPPIRELKPKKKPIISHAGKKVYIGGIKYDDLIEKEYGSITLNLYKEERVNCIKEILESFGPVEFYEDNWEKEHGFVVYNKFEDAKVAIKTLQDYKSRKSYVRGTKERLKEMGLPVIIAPNYKFYVRWPKFYTRMLHNKKKYLLERREKRRRR